MESLKVFPEVQFPLGEPGRAPLFNPKRERFELSCRKVFAEQLCALDRFAEAFLLVVGSHRLNGKFDPFSLLTKKSRFLVQECAVLLGELFPVCVPLKYEEFDL